MTSSANIVERLGPISLTPAQWYLLAAGWFMVVHAAVDLPFVAVWLTPRDSQNPLGRKRGLTA